MIEKFTYIWIGLAIAVFILLQFITAPFGRHTHKNFGPLIANKWAWLIMEFPSLLFIHLSFWFFVKEVNTVQIFLLTLWSLHYINRSFIYPFKQSGRNKKMPLFISLSGVFFNLINGSINGYFLSTTRFSEINIYLFCIGVLFFVFGINLNLWADKTLINLRKPGDINYYIPQKGMFQYISCPNLFGEIIEWTGFALMAQNLGALSFAVWTFANLAPRAHAHHKWYHQKFENYPKKRKALIPFIW